MKLILDQGLPRSSVRLLQEQGHDVLHTGECGMSCSSDIEIIEFARQQDRVVVTLDSDFHTIMALTEADSPSIIRIRIEGLRAEGLANLLQKVLEKCQDDIIAGAMVSVNQKQIRLRKLPLTSSEK